MKIGSDFRSATTWLVTLTLLAQGATAQAAPPSPEDPPKRPLYSAAAPPLKAAANAASLGPAQPAGLNSFGRLVFQSYRNDNWEIYSGEGNLGTINRLTNDGGSDVHPRFNQDASRVAFASDRTGHFEIYTMAADGTGLAQLTFDAADNVEPFWSPEGARLVYESYRDGQAEVYVMNANGSGQTRLTSDGDFDGQPAWSPDGQQIAFISHRTGGYRVWVMNANGSGQVQLSTQTYSADPAWSPDGSQIAYDADGDSNGWQDIWLMNADGSNQHLGLLTASSDTDALVRSWTPDGRAVAFTAVQWVLVDGNWYWQNATVADWNTSVPDSNGITYLIGGLDWLPDWRSIDPWPPVTSVQGMPAFSRSPLTLSWTGSDAGPSGALAYQVQYRQGSGGDWTDWVQEPTPASFPFPGTPGVTYYFRSRGVDYAGNVEAWPPGDGDAHTTIYDWALSGSASDNAGTPLAGVSPALSVQPLSQSASDASGSFSALAAANGISLTVNWSKSGYGALPPTSLDLSRDAQFRVVLPPADNLLQNSGFESGSLGPAWSALGAALPVVTQTTRHTGQAGAELGQDEWFAPSETVTQTSFDAGWLQSGIDISGTIHAVWLENNQLYYARRDPNGTWSSALNISHNAATQDFVLAVESSGVADVVWHNNTGVFYTRRAANGAWSAPANIFPIQAGAAIFALQGAVAADGTLQVMWSDHANDYIIDLYYARRASGGAWDAPQSLTHYVQANCPSYGSCVAQLEQVTVEAGGNLHAVWTSTVNGANDIHYARRNTSGAWDSNLSFPQGDVGGPRLALAGNGLYLVAWHNIDGAGASTLAYRWRAPNGTWSDFIDINHSWSDDGGSLRAAADAAGRLHVVWDAGQNTGQSVVLHVECSLGQCGPVEQLSDASSHGTKPAVAIDTAGTVHVVWIGVSGIGLFHTWRSPGSGWSAPQQISNLTAAYYGTNPQLLFDASRGLHLLWMGQPTYPQGGLLYLAPAHDAQTGESAISQAMTIPAAMKTATLSFLYRLGGASAGDRLEVKVSNGLTTSVALSRTANSSDWSHAWVNVGAWAGQTVSVTLSVHAQAGTLATWAELDEVTLGAGHDDVWVKVDGPGAALPGRTVVYQLSYGNQGGVAAQQTVVSYTLPSQLLFVAASPVPAGNSPLHWTVGDLAPGSGPLTIVVTATVQANAPLYTTMLTGASIGSATPELELANNSAQGATTVGAFLFLPVIRR